MNSYSLALGLVVGLATLHGVALAGTAPPGPWIHLSLLVGIAGGVPIDRRRMLALLGATAATFAAGCTSNPTDEPDDDEPDENPTPSLEHLRLWGADCESQESATVSFHPANEQVIVNGCVTGATACHYPEVASAGYVEGVFQLVVVLEYQGPDPGQESNHGDEDEACAQVLTDRGYRAEVNFDGGVPSEVEVVHEDVHGRAIITTASR